VSEIHPFTAARLVAVPSAVVPPVSVQSVSLTVRNLESAGAGRNYIWSSSDLLCRGRTGDSSATTALYAGFQRLLSETARSSGLSTDVQNELTTSFLSDIIMHLFQVDIVPIHLDSYVSRSFRNRLVDYHRERLSRERRSAEAATILSSSGESAVASCCSEHALRAASGPDADERDLSPKAVSGLLSSILGSLSPTDRALLDWVAVRASSREIADALGISTIAAKVRLHRLRLRLRRASVNYLATLEQIDRMELLKLIPSLAAEG
jgi:RNA polymerase sigma factor (sigma-70 family)